MTLTAESCPQCGGTVPITSGDRVACPYCGTSLVRIAPQGPEAPPDIAAEAASAWGVRMKRARLDAARTHLPVFEWLIPAGWDFQGAVTWRNSVAMPALIAFKAWNPGGAEQIECLPTIPNTWTSTAITAAFRRFQPKAFGFKLDGLEQRAPLTAAEALRHSPPEAGSPPQGDGARVRIRYALEGRDLEEDLFCVVSSVTTQSGSGLLAEEHVHWVAESLFAFRAEHGRIDAMTRGSMASVRSLRMNPQWFAAYQAESQRILQERIMMQQVLQQMAAAQRASFRRQMHRLSDVSRTPSDTSDMIMAGYQERSASYDRMSQGWSEAMRGVDSYAAGGGATVELPGGYQHAWTNGLGEYLLTDSSVLNPNQFASGNWEVLTRRG